MFGDVTSVAHLLVRQYDKVLAIATDAQMRDVRVRSGVFAVFDLLQKLVTFRLHSVVRRHNAARPNQSGRSDGNGDVFEFRCSDDDHKEEEEKESPVKKNSSPCF